jgi:hypothetical protein
MVQTMRFHHNNHSVEVSEANSVNVVKINFWCPNVYNSELVSGFVEFDEQKLVEMRNWINKQLLKIKKQTTKNKTKQ